MANPKGSQEPLLLSVEEINQVPECSICNEKYDDSDQDSIPRNLSCGHSLCSKCIFKCMYISGQPTKGGTTVECPRKCSVITVVPEGQIKNLPKNYAVLDIIQDTRERTSSLAGRCRSPSIATMQLQQQPQLQFHLSSSEEYKCDVCETRNVTIVCPNCAVYLCTDCSNDIHTRKGYDLHSLVPMTDFMSSCESIASSFSQTTPSSSSESDLFSFPGEKSCKHHTNELLEYNCVTCCEDVCKVCISSSEHIDHETRLLHDVAIEKKEVLRRSVVEINKCHFMWNNGFDDCQEMVERLFDKSRTLETEIKTRFHAIHSLLHAKEESLLTKLRSESESRSMSLKAQADHLAKVCAIAKDLVEDCEELLHHVATSAVVRETDKILAHVHQYVRSEQDTTPVVSCDIQIDFSKEDQLIQLVESMGEILVGPDRIKDLTVTSTTSTRSEVSLNWSPPPPVSSSSSSSSSSCDGPLTYMVEHSSQERSTFKCVYEGSSTSCVLSNCQIDEGVVHSFRVAARNAVGIGPYSLPVHFTKTEASFLWDTKLKHPKARISNNGYSVSIGENATWLSVGANIVLSHGRHYWEVILERYGATSLSRKAVIGVVSSSYIQWHKSHGIIGIKTCPIGSRSWGLACGTAKKLSAGSTFFNSLGRKHNLFKEGDNVGVLLDLNDHTMAFYRNGEPLGIQFNDVYGPVIPAISFCRNKMLTLRFPPFPTILKKDSKLEEST